MTEVYSSGGKKRPKGSGPVDWNLIPEHMRFGVKEYIEDGVPQGSFLAAVIKNDLKETFLRADDINRRNIVGFVEFFYRFAPINCWGSAENYYAWIKQGGLNGKTQETQTE